MWLAAPAVRYRFNPSASEMLLEVSDIVGFRTSESVNALVVVAHDEKAGWFRACQQLDEFELRLVNVLVILNQQVLCFLSPNISNFIMLAQDFESQNNLVIVIDRVAGAQYTVVNVKHLFLASVDRNAYFLFLIVAYASELSVLIT